LSEFVLFWRDLLFRVPTLLVRTDTTRIPLWSPVMRKFCNRVMVAEWAIDKNLN